MENTKLNIYQKLRKVQTELKAPKGQYNSFGKYAYRSCEDILEALKPLLDREQLVLILSDSMEVVGDRVYVKATATLTNAEDESQVITTSAFAREEESKKGMDSSQLTGSTSSYARKYALNGLFAIDDTKDSDATNTHERDLSEKQVARLYAIASSKGINKLTVDKQVKAKFNKEVPKLNKEEYDRVVTGYENFKGGTK
jgi:hypothetical protein